MEKYLITNKTVALMKLKNKTIIYSVENKEVINQGINKVLEYNCNYYGSSLDGRKKSARYILNIKYKLPILIDESNNIILIQLNSPKNDYCLYLVINKIIDYKENEGYLKIYCLNNYIFNVKISKNSFEKILLNSLKLNNILNWRKSINFV